MCRKEEIKFNLIHPHDNTVKKKLHIVNYYIKAIVKRKITPIKAYILGEH